MLAWRATMPDEMPSRRPGRGFESSRDQTKALWTSPFFSAFLILILSLHGLSKGLVDCASC